MADARARAGWGAWAEIGLVLACWIFPALVLYPGIFQRRVLFWHDVSLTMLPFRMLAGEAVRHGRLPVWTHLSGAGAAPFAEGQAGVFYPLNLAAYALGIPAWADYVLQLWVHLGLAAALTFLWLHRGHGLGRGVAFFAGQVFSLSGFMASHFMHLHMVQAAAWLPAALWLAEAFAQWKRPVVVAAVAAALVAALALVGHPQTFMMVVAASVLWAAVRAGGGWAALRAVGAMGAAGALGMATAAVQLVPTMAHIAAAGARAQPTVEFMRRYSLDWRGLLYLVHPEIFGSYHAGNYFGAVHHYEVCGWVGGAALMLAVVGLVSGLTGRRRGLVVAAGVLCAAGLFLGLAKYNPIYYALVHVPVINKFRTAGRYVLWVDMAVAVLAAIGLEALVARRERARKAAVGVGLVVAVAWMGAPAVVEAGRPVVHRVLLKEAMRRAGGERAVAVAKAKQKFAFLVRQVSVVNGYGAIWVIAGLALAAAGAFGGSKAAAAIGVVAATELGHLLLFAMPYNPWAPLDLLTSRPMIARLLAADPAHGRVYTDKGIEGTVGRAAWGWPWQPGRRWEVFWDGREAVPPDSNVIYGCQQLACRFPLTTRRLWHWTEERLPELLGGGDREVRRAVAVLRKLGTAWLVTTVQRAARVPGQVVCRWPSVGLALVRLPQWRESDIAWIPERVVMAGAADEANRLTEALADEGTAVVEGAEATAGKGKVVDARYAGPRARVVVEMEREGLAVISAAVDPGWRVTVDGRPAATVRVNTLLVGVTVPKGYHVIDLRYCCPGLRAGAWVSVGAAAAWLLWCAIAVANALKGTAPQPSGARRAGRASGLR